MNWSRDGGVDWCGAVWSRDIYGHVITIFTAYSVQRTVYSVQCTVYSVRRAAIVVQSTVLNGILCTAIGGNIVPRCTVYDVRYTVYSAGCKLLKVRCTV